MGDDGGVLRLPGWQHRAVGLSRKRIGAGAEDRAGQMGLVFAVPSCWRARRFASNGRHRRWRPAALLQGATSSAWGIAHHRRQLVPFALGAWIWEFASHLRLRFQAAAIARSDASGRGEILVPAVFALSSMVGPGGWPTGCWRHFTAACWHWPHCARSHRRWCTSSGSRAERGRAGSRRRSGARRIG